VGLLALLVAGFVQNIGMMSMTASLLRDAGERFRSCGSGSWGGQRPSMGELCHGVGGHEGGGWRWRVLMLPTLPTGEISHPGRGQGTPDCVASPATGHPQYSVLSPTDEYLRWYLNP
jgi:hypothetical protein